VLRKGWWKAWAIGIGSVLLAVGAAVAIFLIFTALGAN
jgi:peroxiredoxin family protein